MMLHIQHVEKAHLKGALTLGLVFMLLPAFCQKVENLERQEAFIQLFDKEVQNRAFALLSIGSISQNVTEEGDKIFYDAWVEFEEFLQKEYKPYAEKHGLSQEPRGTAKTQAFFGELASDVLPKKKFYKTMLSQTENYLEKLSKLPEYADEEDLEFARFVVEQEELQIQAIKYRIEGKDREAADSFINFVNDNH